MSRNPRPTLFVVLLITITSSFGVTSAQDSTITDPAWRYVLRKPGERWMNVDFDERDWKTGDGGFGTRGTPASRIGTEWATQNIWMRRTIELAEVPAKPALLLHHDEDVTVFINGKQVVQLGGYTTKYEVVRLDEAGRGALRAGKNVVAVHCKQTGGGQFIDVHVIDADHVPKLPKPTPPVKPFVSDLITKWGADVTAENAWQEYPRPQMRRASWTNLNGEWDYAITKIDAERPSEWAGKILVPFCVESKLSGVQRLLHDDQALWYRRSAKLTPTKGKRTLLNFEAVDYRCTVWLNGEEVGSHVGGNAPFSLDATKAVKSGDNELVVRVTDATGGAQLRGKQTLDPHGIFYTRVSGIWQTVWIEEVAARWIDDVKIQTDAKAGTIQVKVKYRGKPIKNEATEVELFDGDRRIQGTRFRGDTVELDVENARLWSPSDPHLYTIRLALVDRDKNVQDEIKTYTGIRTVGKTRDSDGHLRFTLNDEVIFHWGPLDQGWWPDGLLTPPSDEALAFDIDYLKRAGFNMIRKHIKVEPRRFYYHCDRLGMMVWQDQVSGGKNPPWTRLDRNPVDAAWSDSDHERFMAELEEMIGALENHPSIVCWVPFNEAWGQHRTMEVGKWTVQRDPSRLVNIASGGNFWPIGDVVDEHRYPHPGFPFDHERYKDFIHVMGEFGGHGWPVQGHLWDNSPKNWGYGGLPKTLDEYKDRYRESIRLLAELKRKGIAAGVYTQTTDVEGEINGLMTYDRKVAKIPAAELLEIHRKLLAE